MSSRRKTSLKRKKTNFRTINYARLDRLSKTFRDITDKKGFGNEETVKNAVKELIDQKKQIENIQIRIKKEGGYSRYSKQDKSGKDRWIVAEYWTEEEIRAQRIFIEYQIKSSEKGAEKHLRKFPKIPVIIIRNEEDVVSISQKILKMIFLSITTNGIIRVR